MQNSNLDPYQVLGVKRDAGPKDIKDAYRRLSKTAHPDMGGDAETFERITFARDVLLDADRRALFDRTGTLNYMAASQIDGEAIRMLTEVIGNVLMQDSDPNKHPLIEPIVNWATEGITKAEQQNELLDRARERAERMAKKFRLKDGGTGPNIMADICRRKIADAGVAIERNELTIKITRRVLEIIQNHAFDFDQVHQVQFRATSAGTGGAAFQYFGRMV